jgi:hypothetical protein
LNRERQIRRSRVTGIDRPPSSCRARRSGSPIAEAADPFQNGVRVLITGPQGFERIVMFDMQEDPAVITQRVRETIDE